MKKMSIRLTCLAVLAAATVLPPARAQTPPAPAASAPTVRAEMGPPLQAARQALTEKQFDEAQRQLDLAAAMADKTSYETYVIERMRVFTAAGRHDTEGLFKAVEAVLATGEADAQARTDLMNEASNAAYAIKDYERTVSWAQRYVDAGGSAPNARLRMAQAWYLLGKHEPAARTLDELAELQRAAGQKPAEAQLRLQASNLAKLNDVAGYGRVLERLAADYPKPEYWTDLMGRALRQPGFDERLRIDALRLGLAAQALPEAGFYVELAERALAAGFITEAQRVLDAGFASGKLGQGSDAAEHKALQQRVAKQAEADRPAAGAANAASAAAAPGRSGQAVFNSGYDLFAAGQAGEGIALMEQGLQRGIQRNPDDARLRLGAAYVLTGNAAKAKELLTPLRSAGKADGLSDLARLWLIRAGG